MGELGLEENAIKVCTLHVWDAEGSPPVGGWTTVLWSSFGKGNDPSIISIPVLVEAHADALRARYLAWIYELGESLVKGKRVIDYLALRPGFSYWWMTLLAQKFNASGASQVDNAIKLFAFESLISENKPRSVVLTTNNDQVALTIRFFCNKLDIMFERKSDGIFKFKKFRSMAIYNSLPNHVQAVIYLGRFAWQRLFFFCKKKTVLPELEGEVTFFDIFVHLDRQVFSTGKFISHYWNDLVDRLSHWDLKTNWMHYYFKHNSIPSIVRANKLIEHFNKSSGGMQTHTLIDASISYKILLRAIRDYIQLVLAGLSLCKISDYFQPEGTVLNLWPLFKKDWQDSLSGKSAILNCLQFSILEAAICRLPYQRLGIYIQENQPWEMSLIFTWKAAGHGKLIGVPHTTVRFWDLRYFYDSRSYKRIHVNSLPMPDQVAVNGPITKSAYLYGGYPEEQVTEVEALRFLHLQRRVKNVALVKSQDCALNVLVCGDFLSATNDKILTWLAIGMRALPSNVTYFLKPHPARSVKPGEYINNKLTMSDAPLAELLVNADVVFTSNITSAAVDAYCAGIPVIQILDGVAFNLSPLRGLKGVVYVADPEEFVVALRNALCQERLANFPYFFLDVYLPRWKNLLGLGAADIVNSTNKVYDI